jgi:hypothetical protein
VLTKNSADFFPLAGCRRVIKALDGIAHAEHKSGVFRRCFFPDLLVHSCLCFSCAVAEDNKLEAVLRTPRAQAQICNCGGTQRPRRNPALGSNTSQVDLIDIIR